MAAGKRSIHALFVATTLVAAGAQAAEDFRNVTAGGVLRHGVYGRIEVQGAQAPALIYPKPIVASERVVAASLRPMYLYVPPGQVRKWSRHCAKWQACDQPVLFVRMDASPGRWGKWRQFRADVAQSD